METKENGLIGESTNEHEPKWKLGEPKLEPTNPPAMSTSTKVKRKSRYHHTS